MYYFEYNLSTTLKQLFGFLSLQLFLEYVNVPWENIIFIYYLEISK